MSKQELCTSIQAHLYSNDEEPYDQRDENYTSSEDDSFYCEKCDRDFSSEGALLEHKKEHKLCGIDGCTFSAHPLLIEKHITMQHSTGLYHRIKNVSTPEDIEKWITERKKRYPTKANVELRKAEEIEKVQRGEIIEQKQNVNKRRRKKLVRSHNRKRTIQRQPAKIFSNTIDQKETYRGLHEFSGTLSLKEDLQTDNQSKNEIENDCEENINQISDEEEIPVVLPKFTVTTCSIPSLVANYGSASEESDVPEEIPIKKVKLDNDTIVKEIDEKKTETVDKTEIVNRIHLNTHVQKPCNMQSKDPVFRSSKNKQNSTLNRNSKNKEQKTIVRRKQPYTSQLLQKLLSRSIQHERNLICQCIKYIVDNNFFE